MIYQYNISSGAFNGAMIAQGDFERCYHLWDSMDTSLLLDIEQPQINKILNNKIDADAFAYLTAKISISA